MYDRASLSKIPHHCREAMREYIEHGLPIGSFLHAVLSNDFVEAFGRADETNEARLKDYASFLYCDAPSECWGSPEKVAAWRGLRAMEAKTGEPAP
jgi:hypothetical protein